MWVEQIGVCIHQRETLDERHLGLKSKEPFRSGNTMRGVWHVCVWGGGVERGGQRESGGEGEGERGPRGGEEGKI